MKVPLSGESLDTAAVSAARELLDRVPRLEVVSARHDQQIGSGPQIDGWIEFKHGDDTYTLIIEVKSNGAPRFVRSAVYQLKGYLVHACPSGLGDLGPASHPHARESLPVS